MIKTLALTAGLVLAHVSQDAPRLYWIDKGVQKQVVLTCHEIKDARKLLMSTIADMEKRLFEKKCAIGEGACVAEHQIMIRSRQFSDFLGHMEDHICTDA